MRKSFTVKTKDYKKEIKTMKKLLTTLIAAVICITVCLSLTSCGTKSNELVLGFDAEFPPYGYLDSATEKYIGFDIELAQKVCDNLGYELQPYPVDWDSKDMLLDSGTIDCIWSGFTYEGREDGYTWSDKYISSSIVILTDDSDIKTLADLTNKDVAVQKGSSGETAINKEEKADLKSSFKSISTEADYNTAYSKLKAGSYDAIIIDYAVAKKYQNADSDLIILDETVTSENYAVGFKKGNNELCKTVNDELKKVSEDSEFIKSLCEKYGIDYNSYLLGK